jgi:dicarboxylate transporter 10
MVRMQDDGRLPVEKRRNYTNVFNALARIAREEGVAKLYAGLFPNVSRAMFMTAGQLASYDIIKQFLLQETKGLFKDNTATHFTASTMAGGVATVVTQPIDVLKTRIMAAEPGRYRGSLHCLRETIRAEGMLSLYKGFIPSFTRLAPQTILTFIFLEQLRAQFSKLN